MLIILRSIKHFPAIPLPIGILILCLAVPLEPSLSDTTLQLYAYIMSI